MDTCSLIAQSDLSRLGRSLSPSDLVKTEASVSPDIPSASLSQSHFALPSHSFASHLPDIRQTASNNFRPLQPHYDFRLPSSDHSNPSFPHLMSPQTWNSDDSDTLTSSRHHPGSAFPTPTTLNHNMSFSDEYDDGLELVELSAQDSAALAHMSDVSGQNSEKAVRRRSSKACDQCRKSKCKCERTTSGQPCRNCIMLGTACTFLGPSRKRGPPKGYIDAIEARLHQTEALLGIMLSYNDNRVQSLLSDISQDRLAREIIKRVDNSPYGVKGRKRGETVGGTKQKHPATAPSVPSDDTDINSTHPSNEWQDRVVELLRTNRVSPLQVEHAELSSQDTAGFTDDLIRPPSSSGRPVLRLSPSSNQNSGYSSTDAVITRRQRRRLDDPHDLPSPTGQGSTAPPYYSAPNSATYRGSYSPDSRSDHVAFSHHSNSLSGRNSMSKLSETFRDNSPPRSPSPFGSGTSAFGDDLAGAVGQLSLNEEEEVRYHGKASGLYLLGSKERLDNRNEGGIWHVHFAVAQPDRHTEPFFFLPRRFPKARVWPPLPSSAQSTSSSLTYDEDSQLRLLPEKSVQDHLVSLYFTYAHPSLPVVHKGAFFEAYKSGSLGSVSPRSPDSDTQSIKSHSPLSRRRRGVSTLLFFVILSIGARFASDGVETPPPTDRSSMWPAGDQYFDAAKAILDGTYANSKPSTCQALLLLGYREIGIGAMAQAWTYIGMAIRMAQDLGMHRSAESWSRAGLGGKLFTEVELQERRRIWHACAVMDKYVSTYIGRPLGIFERDFDTPLPDESDAEELEHWVPHQSAPSSVEEWESRHPDQGTRGLPARIISTFNASATLSGFLGLVVKELYSVKPVSSRHAARLSLENLLDRWYIELPDHLRIDKGSPEVVLPNVLTLHMQYWCTVLLLHRPFIRTHINMKAKDGQVFDQADGENHSVTTRCDELCAGAANQITSIASLFMKDHCLARSPVFLCYYIFTAGVMHVTTLSMYPDDPQAKTGLDTCTEALSKMETVWPSANRALELLRGLGLSLTSAQKTTPTQRVERNKRMATSDVDMGEDLFRREDLHSGRFLSGTMLPEPTFSPLANRVSSAGVLPNSHADGGLFVDIRPDASSPVSPAYYSPSYHRWPSTNGATTLPATYNDNTLNSVVMSQVYSTSLVPPDRNFSGNRHGAVASNDHQSRRYNQTYWPQNPTTNYGASGVDGSSFAGLGSAAPQSAADVDQQHLYHNLPDQYSNVRPSYL